MATVNGLVHVMLVDNLERALHFYVDVLGLTESFRWGDPPFYAGLSAGDAHMHLNTVEDNAGKGELYLTVDDADAMIDAIRERAVTIEIDIKTQDYGMRDFSVRDPSGNLLTIGTPLPSDSTDG